MWSPPRDLVKDGVVRIVRGFRPESSPAHPPISVKEGMNDWPGRNIDEKVGGLKVAFFVFSRFIRPGPSEERRSWDEEFTKS